MAKGEAEITATLPGAKQTATAHVTVNNEEITSLSVEPGRLDMAVGDTSRLHILGTAASGTRELFPQADLHVGVSGGSSPSAIRVEKECASCTGAFYGVVARRPGEANIAVKWRDKLEQQVPVTVGDAWTDLRIEPPVATILPGDGLPYRVTAMQGGSRRAVGPEHGLTLTVENPNVAKVLGGKIGRGGTVVRGKNPGRTTVVAQLARQRAEATLDVSTSAPTAPRHGSWGTAPGKDRGGVYGPNGGGGIIGGGEDDSGAFIVPGWVIPGGDEELIPPQPIREAILLIEPKHVALGLGDATEFIVTFVDSAGGRFRVPAKEARLESLDPTVLAPDPNAPGRFVAKGYGSTKIHAETQGREVDATVEVTGQRFAKVTVLTFQMGPEAPGAVEHST